MTSRLSENLQPDTVTLSLGQT